jgi:ABC-type branched-subunit amino acid transport system substrate-binding protein
MAYFYSKRPERKFYILNQDYMFGHELAEAFKRGLKKYKPDAEIVGEDYHQLFLKDFAPYLTKIKASRAEVIFSGDWLPDAENLLKQARGMGINLPVANCYMDSPGTLEAIGGPAGVGMVNGNDNFVTIETPEMQAFASAWNNQWQKVWKAPYNTTLYMWPGGVFGRTISMTYWLIDVMERVGTTDAEKIIKTWENDEYKSLTGLVKMRACDHQLIRDLYISEFVYPNKYYPRNAGPGTPFVVPAKFCMPPIPGDLDRCKK